MRFLTDNFLFFSLFKNEVHDLFSTVGTSGEVW